MGQDGPRLLFLASTEETAPFAFVSLKLGGPTSTPSDRHMMTHEILNIFGLTMAGHNI